MAETTARKARMTIDIDEKFRNQIKARASLRGMKMRDYVINSLENQMLEDDEDELLGQFAIKAHKEGYIGVEASQKLMDKLLKNA